MITVGRTKLLAWFQLNRESEDARKYLYSEIPQHYIWTTFKTWRRRQRGSAITRLYNVNPKNVELYHLRLLLLYVRGATSYDDLKTVADSDGNKIKYSTFRETALALGIAKNYEVYRSSLLEVINNASPYKIRELFAFILALNVPNNALELWEEFKEYMIQDFIQHGHYQEDSINRALIHINNILVSNNTSCQELGLMAPKSLITDIDMVDIHYEQLEFERLYASATIQQKSHIDTIISTINDSRPVAKMFYIDAPAGCGKTYLQRTLMAKLKSVGQQVLPVAFTGIAASLVDGGRTLHNAFKLPIPLLETSVSGVKPNSELGKQLQNVKLIIMDEVSMTPSLALTVIDRFFKDLATSDMRHLPLGGKAILFCGDFRQTLPIVPHAGRSGTIEACIKHNILWSNVVHLNLTENMRVNEGEEEFAKFLLTIGNGELPISPDGISSMLPNRILGTDSPIDFIYGNINIIIDSDNISDTAILAPKNNHCAALNEKILDKLPGNIFTYNSIDTMKSEDTETILNFPIEFLNSLEVSGLPRHHLLLKEKAIVLLMRNLNTAKGLINGTRLQIVKMYSNSIDCKVLTGASAGETVLIPRIKLTPSHGMFPFEWERFQFPLVLAFAVTINKSQGQSIGKIAIYLPNPVFSHGQLYVALSRARSFDGVKIFINECQHQKRLSKNYFSTVNVVFQEVLNTVIRRPTKRKICDLHQKVDVKNCDSISNTSNIQKQQQHSSQSPLIQLSNLKKNQQIRQSKPYIPSALARNFDTSKKARGDGNCFYHSLSIFDNKQYDQQYYRRQIATFAKRNPSFAKAFLQSVNLQMDHIEEKILKDDEWANSYDIHLAGMALNRPIYVFASMTDPSLDEIDDTTFIRTIESGREMFYGCVRFGPVLGEPYCIYNRDGQIHFDPLLPLNPETCPLFRPTIHQYPSFSAIN